MSQLFRWRNHLRHLSFSNLFKHLKTPKVSRASELGCLVKRLCDLRFTKHLFLLKTKDERKAFIIHISLIALTTQNTTEQVSEAFLTFNFEL